MKQDTFKTEMIFRKDKYGVFALMPYDIATLDGMVTTYQHVGQHSSADYQGCMRKSVPTNVIEYLDLYNELKSLGYNIKIVKRMNHDRYLTELQKAKR